MGSNNAQAESGAVRSFYADDRRPADAVRICRGLSCELHGGRVIRDRMQSNTLVTDVYCLGYCYDSPALMGAGGSIYSGCGATGYAPTESSVHAPSDGNLLIRDAGCEPVVTGRIQQGSVHNIVRAIDVGVYDALRVAVELEPSEILNCIEASGEQGRGGAGYPTGAKWRQCANAESEKKYVVANGDEGDPGSFADRLLLERDPHSIIEGLALCAFAVGAHRGYLYVRSEYPLAHQRVAAAIATARAHGFLGNNILGSGFDFDVELVAGKGSYVCGEETALLNAIEGRRGEVRIRPPYPAENGLFNQPTVVNNVETLVNVAWIVTRGAEAYRRLGTESSPGTKVFSLNAGFQLPGLIEAEFGISLRQLMTLAGGSADAEKEISYVALGGPMGSILSPGEWDIVIDYEQLRDNDIRLGHGGLIAIPEGANLAQMLEERLRFMASESCGKCVPCADGSARALSIAKNLAVNGAGGGIDQSLEPLLKYIQAASLCAFGRELTKPALTLLGCLSDATSESD